MKRVNGVMIVDLSDGRKAVVYTVGNELKVHKVGRRFNLSTLPTTDPGKPLDTVDRKESFSIDEIELIYVELDRRLGE